MDGAISALKLELDQNKPGTYYSGKKSGMSSTVLLAQHDLFSRRKKMIIIYQ